MYFFKLGIETFVKVGQAHYFYIPCGQLSGTYKYVSNMAARKQNSTYSKNEKWISECDLSYAVQKISGRWKLQILSLLEDSIMRFSELKKEFPSITERMLTLQLKALEEDGLIKRTIYPEIPVRVEYELTEIALELVHVLKHLSKWGAKSRGLINSGNSDVSQTD